MGMHGRPKAGGGGGARVTNRTKQSPSTSATTISYASYGALDLHSPVLLLKHRRERCAGGLALEYLLRVGAVRVLEEGRTVFRKELASSRECLESELVLYERQLQCSVPVGRMSSYPTV